MQPYTDNLNIRTFQKDVDPMSLIWHEDQEDRTIEVIEGNGWKFQFDEELPFELTENIIFDIPRGYLHRIIKGSENLTIKIIKK
jgi:hypothetical protein